MNVSSRGLDFIASCEGFRDRPYRDTGGVWTIGFGHTGANVEHMGRISRARGLALLHADAEWAETAVNAFAHTIGVTFPQEAFDALVSAVFNMGSSVLGRGRSLGDALRSKVWTRVPAALLLYVHDQRGVIQPGLVERRGAEGHMFIAAMRGTPPPRWLMPREERAVARADALRRRATLTPAERRELAELVAWMRARRKSIWRAAQPRTAGGDGRGWEILHRRQRYHYLATRT